MRYTYLGSVVVAVVGDGRVTWHWTLVQAHVGVKISELFVGEMNSFGEPWQKGVVKNHTVQCCNAAHALQ